MSAAVTSFVHVRRHYRRLLDALDRDVERALLDGDRRRAASLLGERRRLVRDSAALAQAVARSLERRFARRLPTSAEIDEPELEQA